MTPPSTAPLRSVAFGSPERWGVAWFPATASEGLIVLGDGEGGTVTPARLQAGGAEVPWQIAADGVELTVVPVGPSAAVAVSEGDPPAGYEQRCTVELSGGESVATALPGCRGERTVSGDLASVDSARVVSAWFGESVGAGLLALRPRKAKGHNADASTAAALSSEETPPITDARLSTTYGPDGIPTRMNIELWSDDPDAYPRRLAGEASGPAVTGAAAGWRVIAEPLATHLRGEEGHGILLLIRPA